MADGCSCLGAFPLLFPPHTPQYRCGRSSCHTHPRTYKNKQNKKTTNQQINQSTTQLKAYGKKTDIDRSNCQGQR